MADEYDEFLAEITKQAPATGPVPVTAGSGVDEYDAFLQEQRAAITKPAATPSTDPYDMVAAEYGIAPKKDVGYIDLMSGALQRSVQSAKAMPDSLQGVLAAMRGDLPLAHAHMQKAEEIQSKAPEGVWQLENVSNPDEFFRWLTEKFGENAINIVAGIPLGGVGGLMGNLAVRGLVSKGAIEGVMQAGKMVPSARALGFGSTVGAGAALYPYTVAMETPQTAEEQFKVTKEKFGEVEAQRALSAGLLKGMLELYTPLSIARALVSPGMQLGRTLVGGVAKSFAKEGATEAAQEAIDIYARQLADPGYSYFKNGPTLLPEGWGEGMWRFAEAGIAGGFIGGVFGGAGQKLESRLPGGGTDTSLGTQQPGERYTLPPLEPQASGLVQESRGTFQEQAKQFSNAVKETNIPLSNGLVLQKKLSGGAISGIEYSVVDSGKVVAEARISAPVQLPPTIGEMLEIRDNPESGKNLPFVGTIDRINVDSAYRRKGLASEILKIAEQDLAKVGAKLHPGLTNQTEDFIKFYSARDPAALFDSMKRQGHTAYSDKMLMFAKAMRERGKPFNTSDKNPFQESRGDLRIFPAANEINKIDERNRDVRRGPFPPNILPGIKDNDNQKLAKYGPFPEGHPGKAESDKAINQRVAEHRRENFQVIESGIGPVTQLRNTVIPKKPGDKLIQESRATDPRDDVLGVGTLLSTLPRQETREAFLDMVEANTPRYIEKSNPNRVWTDTELELEFATNRAQSEKPNLLRVNQGSLQPGAMTALISDLAPPGSERIYFLQGVNSQEQKALMQQYAQLYPYFEKAGGLVLKSTKEMNEFETHFRPHYDKMLTDGLRVIPSRGAGFYYNGVLEGTETDLKSSQRSRLVALYDPTTRKITPFSGDERFYQDQVPAGSIAVSVDKNKVSQDSVIESADGSFVLKEGLNPQKLTPGIALRYSGREEFEQNLHTFAQGLLASDKTIVEVGSVENIDLARTYRDVTKKIAPAIDKILASLGIPDGKRVGILIDESLAVNEAGGMRVRTDEGIIEISPAGFEEVRGQIIDTGSLESDLLSGIMHELGHQITYWYYHRLPVEVQEKLWYAHQKAMLSYRMGDSSKTDASGAAPTLPVPAREYWISFSEWLAEQFRRWTTSDAQPVGWIDQSFKQGAQKLEQFYRRWEQEFGAKNKVNLSEPDYYFSAFMDYLRGYGAEKMQYQQLLKQETLYSVQQELLDSPVKMQLTKQVAMALQSLKGIIPEEVSLRLNESLDPHIVPGMELAISDKARARWVPDVNLIEMAIGAMPVKRMYDASRQVISHEAMHAYEDLNIISEKEIAVLMADIKGRENTLFSISEQQALRNRIKEYGEAQKVKWSAGQVQAQFEKMRDRELRAYYIQMFADTGTAYSQEGNRIMSWLLAMIERVRNFMQGLGFQTKEDVVNAFFRGEMVARREMRADQREQGARSAMLVQEASSGGNGFKPYQSWRVGDMRVGAMYENIVGTDKQSSKFVVYQWVDKAGKVLGILELSNKMPKGFNIEWIENQSDKFTLGAQMIAEAEKDLGMKVKVSGELTEAGFQQAKVLTRMRGQRDVMDLYTPVKLGGITFYHSPHKIKEMYGFWLQLAKDQNAREQYSKLLGSGTLISQQQAIKVLATYRELYNRLPTSVWSDPRLEQMFNLRRNNERDEVQGSLIREGQEIEESKLLAAVGQGIPKPDMFRESFELKQKLSQGENARASGLSFEMSAPATGLTLEIRNIFKSGELRKEWEQRTGYGNTESVNRELINIAHEGDRIGVFTKYWWHIGQLVRANEKAKNIQGLLNLYQHGEMMFIMQNKWMQQANETARMWMDEVKGVKRNEGVTNTVFALSEMDYLLPAEKAAKTVRMPMNWDDFLAGQAPVANGELFRLFKKHGLDPRDYNMIRRINNDFKAFLDETEAVSLKILAKKFASAPAVHAQAVAELQKDMATFRAKPYFPMMRFGEFTVGVRENGKVVAAYAFETQTRRDAAIDDIRREFPVGDIQVGRVFPNHAEFMTLPGPLLKLIKEELFDKTGKSPAEIALIDKQLASIAEFELLHSPDRTFRKRWMPAHGIPGHSMDAHRAYSHYFMYGARYISRLAMMDDLHTDLSELKGSIGTVGNYAKRAAIVDYAEKWLKYVLEPGRDSGKFRAAVSLWFLGFSPAAAGMNYTQALVTLGTMGKRFGYGKAYSTVVTATTPYSFAKALGPGMPGYEKAYAEMKRQQLIDVGQAPELAAYAEGYNLIRSMSTTKAQHLWRNLQYGGMKMFQIAETHVRNHAMRHAWLLAIKNPNTPRLQELDVMYPLEIADLVSRVGLTHKEAVAFMFAKEAIKETQFVYSRQYDPVFMRGKQKDLLIFFKYTHGMLSQTFGRNAPTTHMLLVFALLYGLSGVPFAEDGNEVLKAIARKLFGKDVDLLQNARAFVKSIVRDGPFDKTGPDLAMHGLSRYGFGLGFLPQHWAAPRFDASANGSMGRIVPGLSEMAHGMATGKKFSDVFTESAQRASGAGYGTFFTLMQYLMEGPSADSKKWEQLMQREVKALAKAYRYGFDPQAETTRSGAKIVKFNASDPDDIATVLAQAAGFTPTKVAQTWEGMRAVQEDIEIYNMRRKVLYVQFDRALADKNTLEIQDVQDAIRRYNEDVMKVDPVMAIKMGELSQSLKQRQQQRMMQEQTLARNKRELMVTDRMRDLYPGLQIEKVK